MKTTTIIVVVIIITTTITITTTTTTTTTAAATVTQAIATAQLGTPTMPLHLTHCRSDLKLSWHLIIIVFSSGQPCQCGNSFQSYRDCLFLHQ
jgi:hypothetical protein